MNSFRKSPEQGHLPGLTKSASVFSIALAMLLLVISSFSFGQSPEIRKAFRYIDIEQPSKALSALEQMVNAAPDNSSTLYYLGLAQLRTGAKDKALATFEKGIAANEKDGLNYAGKGYVRLLEKNPTDAKIQLDKALAVSKSKDPAVLKAVAEAYITDSKYALDAINLLNKAKTINPTDPEIHTLLGDALLLQNKQNAGETVSAYERAAQVDPKFAKASFKVAQIYELAKSNDIALSNFEKAIAADPEYAPAYKELGEIYYNKKDAQKAVQAYEKYLSISETPGQAKFQLAFFYFMAKDYEKANAIFKEVTSNPNVSPIALKYYGYALVEQNKNEEAHKVFDQYFQKAKPEDITSSDYTYLGKLQLKVKEDSLANESFTKALEMDSTQLEPAQLNAETYFKRRKFDKAIGAYTQLIKMQKSPRMMELFNLGQSYFYELQFPQADSLFQILIQKNPENATLYWFSGRARRQIDSTGVQALANPMFEKVIEKGAGEPEKNKRSLIEAYDYFGTYYLHVKPDADKAKMYFEKLLALDPNNVNAKLFMKEVNKPAPKG